MSRSTTDTELVKTATDASPPGRSRMRRLINVVTVVGCIAIGLVALYGISLILTAVIILLLSAMLAYFIYPLVQVFERRLPRSLAIFVAFFLVASVLTVVLFIVASSINPQVASLAKSIQFLLSPSGDRQTKLYIAFLAKFGITKDQVDQFSIHAERFDLV